MWPSRWRWRSSRAFSICWRPRCRARTARSSRAPRGVCAPRELSHRRLILLLLYPAAGAGDHRQGRRHQVDRQFRHPDPDLRHAGLGPEHRRRPRRPARSGLRRLLRRGRLLLRAAATSDPSSLHGRLLGPNFWPLGLLDLPAARRHAGGLLGHPAGLPGAAAAGRLSRHRHAGVRRDHPPGADQLGAGHQRLRRHLQHPAADLLRPAVQRQRRGLCRLLRPRVLAAATAPSSCST